MRALLDRSVRRLQYLCANLLHRQYRRLTLPPLSLHPDEMLGAVVERLLEALREVRPEIGGQVLRCAVPVKALLERGQSPG